MFFSEEKNQKTFAPAPAEGRGHGPIRLGMELKTKVFWLFSSEKNALSSALIFLKKN
jgi:hypothetical protein